MTEEDAASALIQAAEGLFEAGVMSARRRPTIPTRVTARITRTTVASCISERRSCRSARAPENGLTSNQGTDWQAATAPTSAGDVVSDAARSGRAATRTPSPSPAAVLEAA